MSETNKDIIRRYQDAYNRNDLDVLDEVLDPNWTTNGWPEVMPQTIEAVKELYQVLLASFPDLHYETLDLIAEGDKVVQHWKARGTLKGELFGLPPTGEVVEADGISIFRIAGGKIVVPLRLRRRPRLLGAGGRRIPRVPVPRSPQEQLRLSRVLRAAQKTGQASFDFPSNLFFYVTVHPETR